MGKLGEEVMKVGFIGFGEAAYEISKGLISQGFNSITAYDVMQNDDKIGPLIHKKADETNIQLANSLEDLVADNNIIFSAVPASNTLEVFQNIKNSLKPNTYYVDLTAATPDTKKQIESESKSLDVNYIDAALMGPVPVYKHKVPMLISGNGAEKIHETFSDYEMDLTIVGESAGNASAIKLIRSIYMKGLSTLMIEMLSAAKKENVSDIVIKSIAETMNKTDFEGTMSRLVKGTAIHSGRRAGEMEGVIQMLNDLNLNNDMSLATQRTLQNITDTNIRNHFVDKNPDSWHDVINYLNTNSK